jgi:hypothetical protein
MIHQRAHQNLDLLIGNNGHLGPARILQTRSKKVHKFLAAIMIANLHLAKVMLSKLPSQAFKARQWLRMRGSQARSNLIDRRLAA